MKKNYNNNNNKQFVRTNYYINAQKVLVIRDNENLGIFETRQAVALAKEQDLDLIEVSPQARPPVCIIADYGKWLYEKQKKQKKQKAALPSMKEIRLSPTIDQHDLEVKANSMKDFLEDGHNVLILLRFKGRHNAHVDEGKKVVNKLIDLVKDFGKIESEPSFRSSTLSVKIIPSKPNKI